MSSLGINKVILIGHLGKDPEVRVMQNGKEMASFSLATSESWVDKASGIRTEKTEWHNIVVFSEGLVKIVKSCARKGNKVYLEGSLKTRKWVDQNNNDRYTTEVVLQGFNSTFCMLDSKGTSDVQADRSSVEEEVSDEVLDVDHYSPDMDEIPF